MSYRENKPIKINGKEHLYKVTTFRNEQYECTIENVDRDEYYAYDERGEGICVLQLDTVDIIELITTGSIIRKNSLTYEINTIVEILKEK